MRIILAWRPPSRSGAGCGSSRRTRAGRSTARLGKSSRPSIPSPSRPPRSGEPPSTVHNLTPAGAEPHDIELTAKDVGGSRARARHLPRRTASSPQSRRRCATPAAGRRRAAGRGSRRRREAARPTRTCGSTRSSTRGSSAHRRRRSADPARAAARRRISRLDRDYRRGLAIGAARTRHEPRRIRLARAALRLEQVAITGIDPESEPARRSSPPRRPRARATTSRRSSSSGSSRRGSRRPSPARPALRQRSSTRSRG